MFEKCENIYIANFSDRPACLFTGVHQKLSIIFVKKTKPLNGCKIYTSTYNHWSKNERNGLFESINYCRTTKNFVNPCGIAKIGDEGVDLLLAQKLIPLTYQSVVNNAREDDISFEEKVEQILGDENINHSSAVFRKLKVQQVTE